MRQIGPILDYGTASLRTETRSGRVAAAYCAGLIAGTLGMWVVGTMSGSAGKVDPEAEAYLPMIQLISVALMAASTAFVWGGMWTWAQATRRVAPGYFWKAPLVGVVVWVGSNLIAMIPAVDGFLDGGGEWAYCVVAYLVAPLGLLILMTRRMEEA